MAPSKPTQTERDKLVTSLLNFTKTLPERLNNDPTSPSLLLALNSNIKTLRTNQPLHGASRSHDLDRAGTEIWNLSLRTQRGSDPHHDQDTLHATLRAFAFLLIDSVQFPGRRPLHANLRIMKTANKAARYCLDARQVELAQKVLESGAACEDALAETLLAASDQDAIVRHAVYRAEYLSLRILLAFRQDRLEIAEGMYEKLASSDPRIDPGAAETLADLLLDMGKELHRGDDSYRAVKWLERAHSTLAMYEMEKLSSDASDLRLNILHHLVRACLGTKTEATLHKARSLVNLLGKEYGDRLVTSLLKLDLINAEPSFDPEQYYNVIHRIVRTVHLTAPNIKTILHHVHVLKKNNAEFASQALEDFLHLRLLPEKNVEWAEKTFVLRLWTGSEQSDSEQAPTCIEGLVDSFTGSIKAPLTATACHAALTILWRSVEKAFSDKKYETVSAWCRLLLKPAFDHAGIHNRARISRKLILCAIAKHDFFSAKTIFNQMPEATRDTPMTRYIMYKVGLRDEDRALTAECLNIICNHSSTDATLVYACLLEAQECQDRLQTVAALQEVTKRFNYTAPNGVHLPALLRWTARLLLAEASGSQETGFDVPAELSAVFKGAAAQATKELTQRRPQNESQFNDTELQWFLRNGYNTALANYGEWSTDSILGLLDSCKTFLELLVERTAANSQDLKELQERSLICSSLACQLLIKQARAEDSMVRQLELYLEAHKHVSNFRDGMHRLDPDNTNADSLRENIPQLWRRLLCSDCEASIHLKTWDDLLKIIEDCKSLNDPHIFGILADMLLASDATPSEISKYLEAIVTASSTLSPLPTSSTAQTARHLRILHHITTRAHTPGSAALATRLDIITALAQSLAHRTTYPPEEMDWLAVTTFNRAVDAFVVGDGAACARLRGVSLELASLVGDGGQLQAELARRGAGMVFADG